MLAPWCESQKNVPKVKTSSRIETKIRRHNPKRLMSGCPAGPGRAVHDIAFVRLEGNRERECHGGDHVDPQNLRRRDGQLQPEENGREDRERLSAVRRHHEKDRLLDVVVHRASLSHGGADGCEVVVGEHHVRGFLGNLRALDTHGHADVGLLERGRVVHAVARHGNDLPARLHWRARGGACALGSCGQRRRCGGTSASSASSSMSSIWLPVT